MKKSELKEIIRECVAEVLAEAKTSEFERNAQRNPQFVLAHTGNGGKTGYQLLRRVGDGATDWDVIASLGDMDSVRRHEAAVKIIKNKFKKTVYKSHSGGVDGDDEIFYVR